MPFPNKETRKKCYGFRDEYWKCLDSNNNEVETCKKFREKYEEACPSQWVQHFDRKRKYEKFQDRVLREGYDPVEQTKS